MTTPYELEDRLTETAVDLVLSVMASASTKKIAATEWWPRAKSALETAASEATSWQHMVSAMCKKLQIETLTANSANSVCSIELRGDEFNSFRALCERDAVYMVALAQSKRVEQRAEKARIDAQTDAALFGFPGGEQ